MKMVKVVFLAALAVVFSLAGLLFAAPGASRNPWSAAKSAAFVYDTVARRSCRREGDDFQSLHWL